MDTYEKITPVIEDFYNGKYEEVATNLLIDFLKLVYMNENNQLKRNNLFKILSDLENKINQKQNDNDPLNKIIKNKIGGNKNASRSKDKNKTN